MTAPEPPRLSTIGTVADELGVDTRRIDYILRTRKIRPRALAGHTRLFDAATVEQIRAELKAIADRQAGTAKRAGRSPGTRQAPSTLSGDPRRDDAPDIVRFSGRQSAPSTTGGR